MEARCWMCRRNSQELERDTPSGFIDSSINYFSIYTIKGKISKIINIEKEVKRYGKMRVEDIHKIIDETNRNDDDKNKLMEIVELARPNYGEDYWDPTELTNFVLKLEELNYDKSINNGHYKERNVEIALCRICEIFSNRLCETNYRSSMQHNNELYNTSEKEKQFNQIQKQ